MKRRLTTIFLVLAASGLTFADTITLKDGTKYEGKVLSEDADSYEVAIQVTASIKDTRRIPKDTVASVDRSSMDDLAFDKIKDLVPTPDRLSASDYSQMIDKQVKAFLVAFPKTKHKKQARTILTTLEKEKELAESGALKLDGRWINAADREANAFEIDARILVDGMKDAIDAGQYQTALRTFEKLDKDYSATDSYTKGVELAQSAMATYRPLIAAGVKRVDMLIPTRKAELELLTPSQQEAAYEEITRREKAYKARVEQEQKTQTKWLTTEKYHKGPMETVLSNLNSEIKRLDALKLDEIKKAGATYREAYAAAAAGEEETAATLFNNLKTIRVPDRYIAALEAKLAAKVAEMTAPDLVAPPTPDTPDGDTPEGADPDKNASTDPADTEPSDDGEDNTEDATNADAPPVAPREPVAEEGASPMKTILFVVMAVVLIIALVAVFAGGKKK